MGQKIPLALAASSVATAWTPDVSFATPGSSALTKAVVGYYVRNGSLVTAVFRVQVTPTSLTGASGNIQVTGLPLLIDVGYSPLAGGVVSELSGLTYPSGVTHPSLLPIQSGGFAGLGLTLSGFGSASVGLATFQASNCVVSTQFIIRGEFTYFTSA